MKKKILVTVFWLVVWQILSMIVDNMILMAGPIETLLSLAVMAQTLSFWLSIANSALRIVGGFLLGSIVGVLLAYACWKKPLVGDFVSPLVSVLKAAPIASFIILALIWFGSSRISLVISFIVVFPMLYLNTMEGLRSLDKQLLEMADVYQIPRSSRIKYIELPGVYPFLLGAFKIALGMSWRSGVAAELIGQYKLSIGNQLYMDKISLDTAGIFAWTLVIIVISTVFEKVFLFCFKKISGKAAYVTAASAKEGGAA